MTSFFRPLRLALYLSLVFFRNDTAAQEELGEVNIDVLIGPDLAVEGGGGNAWDRAGYPVFSSQGRGVVSSRFIQEGGDPPGAGSALLELTGPNTARLLFRDKDREHNATGLNPFFSGRDWG